MLSVPGRRPQTHATQAGAGRRRNLPGNARPVVDRAPETARFSNTDAAPNPGAAGGVSMVVIVSVPLACMLALAAPGGEVAWWTRGRGGAGGFGAGANGWTSHTLADTRNEHTMATDATVAVAGSLSLRVPPKGTASAGLDVTLLPAKGAALPPQLDLYATFVDSRGRTVPVYLPTRVPIARTVALGASRDSASPLPAGSARSGPCSR